MAKVAVSTRISAPADEVWRSPREGGHLRHLRLADGSEITERLEELDSGERTYTYTITACALPVTNYRSTISVRAEGDASTFEWSTSFEPSGAPEVEVVKKLRDFYQAGFDNLKALLPSQ